MQLNYFPSKGFYFPYVIGLLSKHVEVRTTFAESRNAVQIIPNRNVNFITIKNDTIYVANANFVWRLAPVPIGRQVEELIRANHLEDAITLLENFPAEGGDENAKVSLIYFHMIYIIDIHILIAREIAINSLYFSE